MRPGYTIYYSLAEIHFYKIDIFGDDLDFYMDQINLLDCRIMRSDEFDESLVTKVTDYEGCRIATYRNPNALY